MSHVHNISVLSLISGIVTLQKSNRKCTEKAETEVTPYKCKQYANSIGNNESSLYFLFCVMMFLLVWYVAFYERKLCLSINEWMNLFSNISHKLLSFFTAFPQFRACEQNYAHDWNNHGRNCNSNQNPMTRSMQICEAICLGAGGLSWWRSPRQELATNWLIRV